MGGDLTRRRLLSGGAALATLAPLSFVTQWNPAGAEPLPVRPTRPGAQGTLGVDLTAARRPTRLLGPNGPETPLWGYSDSFPLVIRVPLGASLRARLTNALDEHTSIHWHGLRITNAMDGVPYLTQPPVEPGQSFLYEFTPPDTGTFFFHPHCNTVEQLGRGLAGLLIVEGDETRPYDADLPCVLKDWRLDDKGAFLAGTTERGAGKAGTFGTLRTTNGLRQPTLAVPAGGDLRLRVLNIDNTRVSEIGIEGADAAIIAIDGNPVPPLPLTSWRLGPAMRVDLAVRAPRAGKAARLVDYFAPEPVTLAILRAKGATLERPPFDPAPLYASAIPQPALNDAETLRFEFSATAINEELVLPNGEILRIADSLCLSDQTFWAINRQSWPLNGHKKLPPPLATLKRGRPYLFELVNRTPHMHPIHLHGHTFVVLDSNKRTLPRYHADTVLLAPRERVRVAFVADNPGDWMFHCHIIEHQDTGMMGIIRVA